MTRPETMRIEEAAARLGVSTKTVYRAAKRGEIPVLRVGRLLLVRRAAFERMLEEGNVGDKIA